MQRLLLRTDDVSLLEVAQVAALLLGGVEVAHQPRRRQRGARAELAPPHVLLRLEERAEGEARVVHRLDGAARPLDRRDRVRRDVLHLDADGAGDPPLPAAEQLDARVLLPQRDQLRVEQILHVERPPRGEHEAAGVDVCLQLPHVHLLVVQPRPVEPRLRHALPHRRLPSGAPHEPLVARPRLTPLLPAAALAPAAGADAAADALVALVRALVVPRLVARERADLERQVELRRGPVAHVAGSGEGVGVDERRFGRGGREEAARRRERGVGEGWPPAGQQLAEAQHAPPLG
mmetsp:Transcript_40423/g.100319  ORF Transcript_40423/g.100319 Transcript_40423/m.100319 type:complete len:291 (-) Transcript_40423:25-897(-)